MLEIPVEGQGMKPEVLLLLKDDPAAYRVLVMHDHIAGGWRAGGVPNSEKMKATTPGRSAGVAAWINCQPVK